MAEREREMNLLKVRKNDPYVNRSRFRVVINERYAKNRLGSDDGEESFN